jgi:outer membrane lipoprotein carrier protein
LNISGQKCASFESNKKNQVLMNPTRKLTIALLLVVLAVPSLAFQTKVSDIARATDEHYNRLKTFKADFTEDYRAQGVSRTESGVLWLKKPGRMRWEYRQPRQKLFLSDSHTAFFYVPGEQQARKTPIKNLDDIRSPLRYLLGKTKLEKELDALSLAPDIAPFQAGDMVLRGVPRGMKDRVSEVVLEISPAHQITRILIREVDGTTTEFRFTGVQENLPVEDGLFRFTPPPGVELIPEGQITQ